MILRLAPSHAKLLRALPKRQHCGRLRHLGLAWRAPLPKPGDHRSPFGVGHAVHVIPPLFRDTRATPGERVGVAEAVVIVVIGPSDWHRSGRTAPHDAAGAYPNVLANVRIGGFINDDGKLFEIAGEEESDKIVRLDDADEVGGHGMKPAPPVQIPVHQKYTGRGRRASLSVSFYRTLFSGNFVFLPKLKGEATHYSSTVDMGECVCLIGYGTPPKAFGGSHLLNLDKNVERAFGVLVHTLAEKAGEIRFGDLLLWHWSAPLDLELTSNLHSARACSSLSKQIVNFSELFLGASGCGSDCVGLLAVGRQGDNSPICLETLIANARYTNQGHPIATRLAAKFLQYDQFKITGRDELLCHAEAPVRVARSALLPSECLYASANIVSALRNDSETVPCIGSRFQVVSLRQFDALFNDFASELWIIVVSPRHCSPTLVHPNQHDRFGFRALGVNPDHQRQHVFQILRGPKGESCHRGALSSCDLSPTLSNQCRSKAHRVVSTLRIHLFVLIGSLDPNLDHVVDVSPVRGNGGDATFVDAASKFCKRIKSSALRSADVGRRVDRRRFSRKAIDKPSCIFLLAVERCLQDGAAIPCFQETDSIGHCAELSVAEDSLRPEVGTNRRRLIGPEDNSNLRYSVHHCAGTFGTRELCNVTRNDECHVTVGLASFNDCEYWGIMTHRSRADCAYRCREAVLI